MSRTKITPQKGLADALARSAASSFSDSVTRARPGRSFADILSDLYTQTDELLADVAASGEPPLKRAEALKSIAKILPLLQQAERNARTTIKRKALEEMTDMEIEQLNKALDKRHKRQQLASGASQEKSRIPLTSGSAGGNTHPLKESAESESSTFPYTDGTEIEPGDEE